MKTTSETKILACEPATKAFGQPSYETHPHIINKDEVTPMITKSEYQKRRNSLMDLIFEYTAKKNLGNDVKRHLVRFTFLR